MFAHPQKVPVSFLVSAHVSIHLSACLHVSAWLPLDRCLWNSRLESFIKIF